MDKSYSLQIQNTNSSEYIDDLDKIKNISNSIDLIYPLDEHSHFTEENCMIIFNHLNDIIEILNKYKGINYSQIEDLIEFYKNKKKNFLDLRKKFEFQEKKENPPSQTHQDMIGNIINSCITSCENLNKNNIKINVNQTSSQSSQVNSTNVSQSAGNDTISIDFTKLNALYIELLNTNEANDILYEDINEKIKELIEINENLDNEIDNIETNVRKII